MSPATPSASRVAFTEAGRRDGLQSLPVELSTEGKLELIEGLRDSGPDSVEAAAFVSFKWVPQLVDAESVLAELVASRGRGPGPAAGAGVQPVGPGASSRALPRRVLANIGASDTFDRRNLNGGGE